MQALGDLVEAAFTWGKAELAAESRAALDRLGHELKPTGSADVAGVRTVVNTSSYERPFQ